MAYMQNGLAVPYNGRWHSRELTQFVRAMMTPMKRFSNPDELLTVMASNDAIVVSFVDLLVHRSYFTNFYKTAVKWIEKDPNQEVVFGVVTGDAMKQFGVEGKPVVRMYLWNDTIVSRDLLTRFLSFSIGCIHSFILISHTTIFRQLFIVYVCRNIKMKLGHNRTSSDLYQQIFIKLVLGCHRPELSQQP